MNTSTPLHKTHPYFKILIPILGLSLILYHWFSDTVKPDNLMYDVNEITHIPFFETPYIYMYAHLFALIPVLSLSFDKKVAYYKKWKFLFPALIIAAIPYWIWDIGKTAREVWGFNPVYFTFKIINLPIEEWLFFITFPFATVFIYECLNAYFPRGRFLSFLNKIDTPLSYGLIFCFFSVGIFNWSRLYTVTTFWIAAYLLLWQYLFDIKTIRLQFYRTFPVATIPFILVNGVFTGAFTAQPIVIYNPDEYIGGRFFTIPYDDFIYNFGLQLAVIMLYNFFKKNA
jgi:lycopene cyclase domain-containing protein